jgi:rare lipoprotein A
MKRLHISIFVTVAIVSMFLGCSSKKSVKPGEISAARHRATMRSYKVHGKRYYPTYVSVGDTMKGVCSWYGPKFHGGITSSGERYNMYARTAAHKTWPMNTMVEVKNLDNGKKTVVRINDRGPFVRGRVLDCSYAAGKEIGLDRSGVARVELRVLGFAGKVYRPSKSKGVKKPSVRLSDFGVQVGAFRRKVGAEIYRRLYAQKVSSPKNVIIREFFEGGAPLYRVWVMGFGSRDEALDFIDYHDIDGGFIIRK